MCRVFVQLLILTTLSSLSCAADKLNLTVFCADHRKAFRGSCYEFVDLQLTFSSGEAWCEQRGGHLAFITDEETQYLLQKHLDPRRDVWFGAALSIGTNLQYSVEDHFTWLDGSLITYSNWVSSPHSGAACGYIMRDSGFQWEATRACNKRLPFICQFESGRSIVCAGRNTTLQCGSGKVLMIDGGFYGRKNIHYCRPSSFPQTTPPQLQCSWVDVAESLTAHCHGRQVCHVTEVVDSFGEPCPELGSYLSLDYHCKDGLKMSVSAVAAVFHDVTISVKWLLDLPLENLSCKLSTGDGHVIFLHTPEGLENGLVHKYTHPGTFIVGVECTSSENYITAQEIIAIQEPIGEFGVITCYARKLSFHASDCKALFGEQFQIQMEVKAGTNVTYRVQKDELLLSGLSVIRGNVPQNITLTSQVVEQLGPGCHQLRLRASNIVTFPEVSANLQICVLEKIAGLQASVLTERDDCVDSADITVGVSLERGAPVLLLFSSTGDNDSFFETTEMHTKKDIFHIGHKIHGPVQMNVRAWNVFSSSEVDVFASCGKDSVVKRRHTRMAGFFRSLTIRASPSATVDRLRDIELSITQEDILDDDTKKFEWSCTNPCKCQRTSEGEEYTIDEDCLPNPYEFNKYRFKVKNKVNNHVVRTKSICITLNPKKLAGSARLDCFEGCNPIRADRDAKIKLHDCRGGSCNRHVWYVEDQRDAAQWHSETRSCYQGANQRPFELKQSGGNELHVNSHAISTAMSAGRNIKVVVIAYNNDDQPRYIDYTLQTSSSRETSAPTTGSSVTAVTTVTAAGQATTPPGTSGGNTITTISQDTANPPGPTTTAAANAATTTTAANAATTTTAANGATTTTAANPATTTTAANGATTTTAANAATTTTAANGATTTTAANAATTTTAANGATTTTAANAATTTTAANGATTTTAANAATTTTAANPAATTTAANAATTTTTANGATTTTAANPATTTTAANPATTTTTANGATTTTAENAATTTTAENAATTATGVTSAATPTVANTPTNGNTGITTTAATSANTDITTTTSEISSTATTNDGDSLQCSISPQSGTILDPFSITCNTEIPCSNCRYCFKTNEGKRLLCSEDNEGMSIYLPLGDSSSNYNLIIKATAEKSTVVASTTITVQVQDSSSSVDDLKDAVKNAVHQLKNEGRLSGVTVGQVFTSVSNKLNDQSDASTAADRQKLREQMLDNMIATVKDVPPTAPEDVQVIAGTLVAVSKKGTELSPAAQVAASELFETLSSSLVNVETSSSDEVQTAASTIMEGAGNILEYSSNENVSDALLSALTNTQTALLRFKKANEAPTVIQQPHISMLVNRVTPENLHKDSINIPNCSCPAFSLPVLPNDMFRSNDPMDVRMMSLNKNPFSWNERGNISGSVGALSLTTTDGSDIPVQNLSEDIEILLPRSAGEQVDTSFLDLRNFSTTVINISSADTTLVLKMLPSKDPLPFKVFLGYMDYPTDTNYVATTEMPLKGTTQEEKYTWLLEPKDLNGNTGLHYLLVRPIVGPGIKSINASLSITPINTACKFWNDSKRDWSNNGCKVGVRTTPEVTQCLCNHLTFFGSSFFVTPNLVDPSRTAELFATFAENPVVVCFVGALFVVYLVVVVWARRKDIQDAAKVKVTVLEDNDPMDEYRYLLSVCTGHRRGASTSSQVTVTLLGAEGNSEPHHLTDPKKPVFERGAVDLFLLTAPFSLGDLQGIRLWHNNSGSHPDWYVGNITVQDQQTEQKWHFLCNSWLAIDIGDGSLDRVFPVSTEMDLKRFSNLFFMKTSKDFSDGHLWYSIISRPPSSTFTCVQRVSCCFSLLLCTMLTSIMFYGIPTDPSEQTLDLGHFEFTWQQFMIGVQSSLIMFPVNILIVSIFRFTRPRETSCCRRKTKQPDALQQTSCSQTASSNMNDNVTLETVIKDITRLASSISKTVKSNIPCKESEFGPGQEVDVNAVLSEVEDFIKQNNKTTSETPQSKTQSLHSISQPEKAESSVTIPPGSTAEGIQKNSNKTQYLYRQLCHIDKELSQLGPSGFPTSHSYNRAVQQVQGMKGLLEDQLFKFNSVNADELTQKKLSPADSTEGDGSQKKKCFSGGLPWWFVFFGWLLVVATSVVSGYFTMLYGLKFGKDRSVSWLVSMIVSFFQSILVIQPLKVLCLAVFFALVIKKVDEEDYQTVAVVGSLGDGKDHHMVRLDSSLYQPPPPADIEKMRRNKILEQRAFALLVEILTYTGFMWMLLLVAYGQRDPNAFFLNQHIRKSFSSKISDSMSLGNVFEWSNTTLLSNLFGAYPGFITDGNSKLVGNARLRQLRVQKNSCQIAGSMLRFVPDCHAPYSWDDEDMGSYGPGWNDSMRNNFSTSTPSPWKYQTQDQLRAHPVWGKMTLYRGGGFVAELGPDLQNASSTLEYLFKNKWLDMYTRAMFVEFTVYNANVNLFCIVTLLLETTAIGAFQFISKLQSVRLYQSTGGLHIFVMAAEIIYMLFILYYMFLQGKLMKQQKCTYFKNKWNLLELTIILLSWSAVGVFIQRTVTGNRDMTYYHNHKDKFASFYETANADLMLQYLIAFLVLLSTVKLWHLLRLNPKMNMITATLQRAWSDISGFLLIILIMFVAYSVASNVIYGWKLPSYRTFANSLIAIISLQIGIFNYNEVLNCYPLLGGLLFGSCIVFMSFVVLNLLISVILVAFNEEQIYHKPSDEEEIVDLLLKKICSLFGIRYKTTKETQLGPDVNVDSGSTLNNSRNILNNSSTDVNILHPPDNSVHL